MCVFLSPPGVQLGSLRKMLGSERGVVEEWLLEFKVKASPLFLLLFLSLPRLCLDADILFVLFWRNHTVGGKNDELKKKKSSNSLSQYLCQRLLVAGKSCEVFIGFT